MPVVSQVRFYSDDAAMTFVRREFPEYFEAYLHLPKDVERADFFRWVGVMLFPGTCGMRCQSPDMFDLYDLPCLGELHACPVLVVCLQHPSLSIHSVAWQYVLLWCRYMVVLRLGGAYADVDAECRQPLDSIIQPADTMLVGWDTEVSNATSAAASGLARQRLIANWFFVASAGHPVLRELCDHIARNTMTTFSNNTVRDTAERTGQAVWTDVVLRHALQHHTAKVGCSSALSCLETASLRTSFMFLTCAVANVCPALLGRPLSAVVSVLICLLGLLLQHDDPWKVRILPRVAFGVRPMGDEPSLRPDSPGVVVLHHFMSSWQTARRRSLIQVLLSRDR